MTTIAFRDGILAADTQVSFDNIKGYGRKLHQLENGAVLAFSGWAEDEVKILEYYNHNSRKKPTTRKKYEYIYINTDGVAYYSLSELNLMLIEDRFHAIGVGWQIAITAMHIGLSATDAVKIAGELNLETNTFVDVYNSRTRKLTKSVWPHEKKK